MVYKSIDHGFFRLTNTYPQVKYFCVLGLMAEDMEIEQYGYIKNDVVDFIISPTELTDEIVDTSYHLVDFARPYYWLGNNDNFYLYQK